MKSSTYYAQRIFPVVMCTCIFIVTVSTIIYMAKDNVYSNMLYAYFNITPRMHSFFMNLPVSTETLLRSINLSTICFNCIGLVFPIILTISVSKRYFACLITLAATPFIVQVFLLDPFIVKSIYFGKWGFLPDVHHYTYFYQTAQLIFHIINNIALGVGFILLIRLYYTAPKLSHIRMNIAAMSIGLFLLETIYIYVFGWAPVQQLWMSRVAGLTLYKPLPVGKPSPVFNYYPLFTLGIVILFVIGLYRYLYAKKRIELMDWEFSSKVDMAETTVRALCHFIKNELLAINSEVEQLQAAVESNQPGFDSYFNRINRICDATYDRLNQVHRMTGFRRICLSPIPLCKLICEVSAQYRNHKDIQIRLLLPDTDPVVMGDELYLKEAVNNIICNAIEAFINYPQANKLLQIVCDIKKGWVVVDFSDNGPGISAAHIKKVFEPFFSSKPLTTNWGIGLALCKRIVLMHKGKLEVQSGPQGTTFTMALPHIHCKPYRNK